MPTLKSKFELRSVFSHRADTLSLLAGRLKTDVNQELIHDARVAMRRFLVVLDVLICSRRKKVFSELKTSLDVIFYRLGKIRDLQLQYETSRLMISFLKIDSAQLEANLEKQRKHKQKLKLEIEKHLETIQSLLSEFKSEVLNTPEKILEKLVQVQLEKTKSAWIAKRAKAANDLFAEYHSLRIALKKFRYVYEIAVEAQLDGAQKSALKALRNEQDVLGNFHDFEVFL